MKNLKLITTLVLAFAFLFAQVGNVAAAPLAQEQTPITGTITSIVLETDANGVTTALVTLEVAPGVTQTVRVSEATAAGFIVGQTVTIDPAMIILDTPEEEAVHPISALLAAFFDEDASVIDAYHSEDGFGFGVIAQALWMSRNLTGTEEEAGDASLVEDILTAKQDKDYESFFELHPEYLENFDGTAPSNWGQFKKVLLEKKNNLGNVVSGHAEEDENSSTQSANEKGKGNGKGQGNGKGHGKGHNKP